MIDIHQYANKTKYTEWYFNLIEKSKKSTYNHEDYYELHHIIPVCVDDKLKRDKNNLVKLSAREHYIAHWILTKMFVGDIRRRLLFAFNMMHVESPNNERKYKNSIAYETNKKNYSKSMQYNHWTKREENKEKLKQAAIKREKNLSDTEKEKRRNRAHATFSGITLSDDHKEKISKATTGVQKTKTEKLLRAYEKQREKFSSGEWISPTQGQTRERIVCPYCGKSVDIANYTRWHDKKCKNFTKNTLAFD